MMQSQLEEETKILARKWGLLKVRVKDSYDGYIP